MRWNTLITTTALLWASCVAALAGPPPEAQVQGLYEGTWKEGTTAPAEVRCVAMGKHQYKLLARREVDGRIQRAEIDGAADQETGAVTFEGTAGGATWKATYAGGAIMGTIGDNGRLDVKRVVRKPPTLGKKPPAGAVVLIDGKNFDNMSPRKGEWGPVNKKDGSIQVPKGGMNSVPKFSGSYDAHVEFMCNLKPTARSQGRGNSGTYLPNGVEIQVLDSFGTTTYLGGGCGGLYKFKNPDTMEPIPSLEGRKDNVFNLASLPPEQWQTYDIEYRVKKDDKGKPVGSLTVHHNGIKIHDAVEVRHRPGGFHFQDHGNPVRYRNIWVVEHETN